MLLAPSVMLAEEMRQKLLTSYASLLLPAKTEPTRTVVNTLEILIRSTEVLGGEQGIQILLGDSVQADVLGILLRGIRGSWESRQMTGPRRKDSPIDNIIKSDYFLILARLAFASPFALLDTMWNLCSQSINGDEVNSKTKDQDSNMDWLLEEWFETFDSVTDPSQRKIMCLALTRFIESGKPWILSRLQDLMTVWTDVISELVEGMDENHGE